jgi:hypothetical protein
MWLTLVSRVLDLIEYQPLITIHRSHPVHNRISFPSRRGNKEQEHSRLGLVLAYELIRDVSIPIHHDLDQVLSPPQLVNSCGWEATRSPLTFRESALMASCVVGVAVIPACLNSSSCVIFCATRS